MAGEIVEATVLKSGSYFVSPLGKFNLLVTSFFFIILIITGIYTSVEQKSIMPLTSNTAGRLIGADTQVGQIVDEIESNDRPAKYTSFFSKQMPVFYFWWAITIWKLFSAIWFIYLFGWLCYGVFYLMNSALILRNILLGAGLFMLISLLFGMIIFTASLSGLCLTSDKTVIVKAMWKNSYPFHGMAKLVTHIWNKDLFHKISDWATDNGLGQAISGIPNAVNLNQSYFNNTNIGG